MSSTTTSDTNNTTESQASSASSNSILSASISTTIFQAIEDINFWELQFIRLQNIYSLACQISFFILSQFALNNSELMPYGTETDKHIVTALTTLLLYSIISYFVAKIRGVFQNNRRIMIIDSPTVINYMKWLLKLFFEFAKVAVIIMCLRDHDFYYKPRMLYTSITFFYYLCTERVFIECLPSLLELFNIRQMENLEHLYVPFTMNIVAILFGLLMAIYSIYINYTRLMLLGIYFMVYLRIKDAYYNYWNVLIAEKKIYENFEIASDQDIQEWNDICAVCLNRMSNARITPCKHLFHPYCLKRCLKDSYNCPLCKQPLEYFIELK